MQRTALLEFNQEFIDHLSDGLLHMKADGSIIYANQAIKDWLNATTDQVIGSSLFRFFPVIDFNRNYGGDCFQTFAVTTDHIEMFAEVSFFKKDNGHVDLLVRHMEEKQDPADRIVVEKLQDDPKGYQDDKLEERRYQQYHSLFQQNTVPIFSINLDGIITDTNPSVQNVLGFKKDELVGRCVIDALIYNYNDEVKRCFKNVLQGKRTTCDLRLKTCKGEVIEFQFSHIPIYVDGRLCGAYCIAMSNSVLRETQQALLESEYRYRQLVEHSPDPVCLHDSKKILYVNDVAVELLGIDDKSEIIGKEINRFIHPDYQEDSKKRVDNVMKGKRFTRLFPMKLIRPDGGILEAEGKSIPIKENGNTYVLAVFRDVTEKNAAKRSLLHSERRYRSLFQHNPDGIYSINLNGELTSINPAIVAITGFTEEEQIGRQYTDFLLADEKQEVVANYEKIFTGKTVKFEKHMTRKDGRTITVRVVGFPMIVDNKTRAPIW